MALHIIKGFPRLWQQQGVDPDHLQEGLTEKYEKKGTFSWASKRSIFSSLNVLLVNTLCSKAFSIFLMATRSFSGSLAFLSLAATTTP